VIVRECPPESMAIRQSPPCRQRCDPNHTLKCLARAAGTRWR
jgi:hypothetical protein